MPHQYEVASLSLIEKINKLDKTSTIYLEKIYDLIVREIQLYHINQLNLHVQAIEKFEQLKNSQKQYQFFRHKIFSTLAILKSREMSVANIMQSISAESTVSVIELCHSFFRTVNNHFEAHVKIRDYEELERKVESLFSRNIDNRLKQVLMVSIAHKAKELLRTTANKERKDFLKKLSETSDFARLPEPNGHVESLASCRSITELLEHAYKLGFNLPPMMIEKFQLNKKIVLSIPAVRFIQDYGVADHRLELEDALNSFLYSDVDEIEQIHAFYNVISNLVDETTTAVRIQDAFLKLEKLMRSVATKEDSPEKFDKFKSVLHVIKSYAQIHFTHEKITNKILEECRALEQSLTPLKIDNLAMMR
ncbi:MAG: hypothetical protein EBQ95_00830 [Gammaproteobacteria bacterium]|nr:hypothetical protein [Gammaproteobacteria bacterium]